MDKVRSQEEQNRMFSVDRVPQAEQVIMRTNCIALRGEAVKPCESASTQQLGNGVRTPLALAADCGRMTSKPEVISSSVRYADLVSA
jgi:hypothetical protein